jgi:P-type Cu2+ transporter
MVKDPVCGMNVDEAKTKHSSAFAHETYYFCSAGCKSRFDAHPDQFVGVGGAAAHAGHAQKAVKAEQGESVYYCPMHPHIRSGSPGKCPECGMQLEMVGAQDEDHHAVRDFRKRFLVSTVLSVPILALSPMIQEWLGLGDLLRFRGDSYVLFALSTIVFFYGGLPFLQGLYYEIKAKMPGMMALIGLAIGVAYGYSSFVVFGLQGSIFFWELATLIDLMLLGHWIEMKSVMGASRALEELAKLIPSEAHKILPDSSIADVPTSALAAGDRVLVRPGEKVPADGTVIEGETDVNESMLTGESTPVLKTKGSAVIGGSIGGEGSITVQITKTGKDSFISQVVQLVESAQQSKSHTQDLANRAALWLTFIAVGSGAATMAAWLAIMRSDFAFALERTVTVMVITCPHALGLAIPLVVAVSTALSARRGLLIRNRTAFEKARSIQAVIFDKTGTLTGGLFGITDVLVFDEGAEKQDLLDYAASVESRSEHPIARALSASGKNLLTASAFRSTPGEGAEAMVNGRRVQVVSSSSVRSQSGSSPDERVDQLQADGKTVVFLVIDGKPAAAIALADIIRPESKEAVATLRRLGIRCMMLTGDNKLVAARVANEIGIEEYFAEVRPGEKASKVKEVQSRGLVVAMVGDGVNDAPALAQADVGMAIGAGTDIAIETADIVLVRSNPLDVAAVVSLARETYRKMVQNLIWATGYNAVAIPLAAGVLYPVGILLSPAFGAVLMSVSTVVVAVNAKMLGRRKEN